MVKFSPIFMFKDVTKLAMNKEVIVIPQNTQIPFNIKYLKTMVILPKVVNGT